MYGHMNVKYNVSNTVTFSVCSIYIDFWFIHFQLGLLNFHKQCEVEIFVGYEIMYFT